MGPGVNAAPRLANRQPERATARRPAQTSSGVPAGRRDLPTSGPLAADDGRKAGAAASHELPMDA